MLKDIYLGQRDFAKQGGMKDLAQRKEQIKFIARTVEKSRAKMVEAARADMGRPDVETFMMEYGPILEESKFALKNIDAWIKPIKVKTPLLFFKADSYIVPRPLGTALVMSAWNFPFYQTMLPAIGAFAAGNTVILKPSPDSPACAEVLAEIVNKNFDPKIFHCFTGDNEVSNQLLELKFDKIFFTGSPRIGKLVMGLAAKNLTPVTLELGGKSPAIVDADAHIEQAAKRIAWGKFFNSGQICVAPDYVFVHSSVKAEFIEAVKKAINEFYGAKPIEHEDYGTIINERNYLRLKSWVSGCTILHGGEFNDAKRKIAPTLVECADEKHPVVTEEVFGPILLVKEFDELDQVLAQLREQEKPLALYYFSRSKKNQKRLSQTANAGGITINDTMMHGGNIHLPFGGVGQSGMGAYHGKYTFDTFTHYTGVMNRSTHVDVPMRYPPFKGKFEKLLKMSRWM